MNETTTIGLPESDQIHHYVVASDFHTEHLDINTFKIFYRFSKMLPQADRTLVINGDFLDAGFLMEKDKAYKVNMYMKNFEEYFVPKADEEFEWGNYMLDELQKIFPRIIYTLGNHEKRYDYFVDNSLVPHAYKHNFRIRERLKLEARGIACIDYNDFLDIGKLTITHGIYCGATHLKKHFEACGARNILMGHVHSHEIKAFAHRDGVKKAISLPCMAKTKMHYVKNRPMNWSNGFASIAMRSDGNFNLYVHEIWGDRLVLPTGEVITA